MWPTPPIVVMTPQTEPRSHGVPRPVSEPSSEAASAKPIEMPAPTDAAMPTRNVSQVLWVANAAANSGASVETEPSIRSGQPRLHILQEEHAPRGLVLLGARGRRQEGLLELVGDIFVLALDLGELQQQLAGRGVAGGVGRAPVEALGFEFHVLREFPHLIEVELRHQPQRLLGDEAFDVLAADQWQVLAEFRPVEVEQHGAMARLLVGHLVEHLGGGRVLLAQALGKAAVDPAVLVLIGDRERQDFLFGEIGETFHGWPHSIGNSIY